MLGEKRSTQLGRYENATGNKGFLFMHGVGGSPGKASQRVRRLLQPTQREQCLKPSPALGQLTDFHEI
jgi:hypothetical protein